MSMKAGPPRNRTLRVTLATGAAPMLWLLTGCLSSHFFADTTPATYFQSTTQIVDGNHNPIPGATFPRPYQPLSGSWVSDMTNLPAGDSNWGSIKSFGAAVAGSSPGTLAYSPTYLTDGNGVLKIENLRVNANWNLYYNWLPLPYGCVPPGDSSGYQVPSAPVGEFISSDPHDTNPNPVPLNATWNAANNDINAVSPANSFSCFIEDRFLTADTLTANAGTPELVSTLCSSDPCSNTANPTQSPWGPGLLATLPLGFGAPVLQSDIYNSSAGTEVATVHGTVDPASNGYRGDFAVSGVSLPLGVYGTYMYWFDTLGFATAPAYIGGEALLNVSTTNTNYSTPFGVGAASFTEMYEACPTGTRLHSSCTMYDTNSAYPVVTDINANTLNVNGAVMAVGTRPVAVATYGTGASNSTTTGGGMTVTVDESGTASALVVNSGSSNVSIVNLLARTLTATIATGATPVAATVDSAAAYAYVANYAGNSVTKIDLKALKAVTSFPVIAEPASIALDGSGNLWVGGNGEVASYSPTTYARLTLQSESGLVTALGISAAQNKVLLSAIGPASGGSGAQAMSISKSPLPSSSSLTSMFQGGASAYTSSTVASMLPSPYLLGGGMVVSAQYGNNFVISATPTGYVVSDISNGAALFSGTTSAPVRAVAVQQTYGCAFLTVPDAHAVITVVMPGGHSCN